VAARTTTRWPLACFSPPRCFQGFPIPQVAFTTLIRAAKWILILGLQRLPFSYTSTFMFFSFLFDRGTSTRAFLMIGRNMTVDIFFLSTRSFSPSFLLSSRRYRPSSLNNGYVRPLLSCDGGPGLCRFQSFSLLSSILEEASSS